ncbi:MAG: hypothetical protein ACFFCZ_29780 [Promethearchaeota archaeon]
MNSNDVLDKDPIKKWIIRLIIIAFVILLVQNGALVIFLGYLIVPFYIIDVIGFLLLAVGYLLYSSQKVEQKRYYFIGGLCLLGWVICRVLYQFIIPLLLLPQLLEECASYPNILSIHFDFFLGYTCPSLPLWTTAAAVMTNFIFLGGLALALGSIVIWRTQKDKKGQIIFMVYGVCNAIVITLFALTRFPAVNMSTPLESIGGTILYLAKGFIVPLLGVIAFFLMLRATYKLGDI